MVETMAGHIRVTLTLTEPGDLWTLYHLMIARQSEMVNRKFRGKADADRDALDAETVRWIGYASQIRKQYEDMTEHEKK